jgi:hypothetical protein
MKKIFTMMLTLGTMTSFACTEELCIGTRIIPEGYTHGYADVVSYDSVKRFYTVKGNESTGYHLVTIRAISMMTGCLDNICVGDKVIPDSYTFGYATVKGINHSLQTIVLQGSHSSIYHRKLSLELAQTKGCLHGICVGDKVLPNNYTEGYAVVNAINFTNSTVTVLGSKSKSYHKYMTQALTVLDSAERDI